MHENRHRTINDLSAAVGNIKDHAFIIKRKQYPSTLPFLRYPFEDFVGEIGKKKDRLLLVKGAQGNTMDWSLIMGRGGLQNGKIAGLKLFAPPPQDRVKLFVPPLLKSGNFSCPPLQYG